MPKNETLILFSRKKIHTYARSESLLIQVYSALHRGLGDRINDILSFTVSEGASGATVSTGAISALPTILFDAKTLLSSVR